MGEEDKTKGKSWIQKLKGEEDFTSLLYVIIFTIVATFPVFILVYRYMPSVILPFGANGWRIDDILLFTFLFIVFFGVISKFRTFFIYVGLLSFLGITILNFSGYYTLENLYYDYNKILYNLGDESLEKRFFVRNEVFRQEEELRKAIDYNNPIVVNWARNKATSNFQEYAELIRDRRIVQFFSIFKEIRSRWVYVFDPMGEDYFSMASETIQQLEYNDLFKGDCDDYSILMAATIRAIGGEVRLVRTNVLRSDGTTIGHLYPEVRIGDKKDLDNIAHVMRTVLFPEEIGNRPIRYYQDARGDVWLNFDYNDHYPGGRYQSDIRVSEMRI